MGFWATVIVASSMGISIIGEGDVNYSTIEECLKRLPSFTSESLAKLKENSIEVVVSRSGCTPVKASELVPMLKQNFPTPESLLEWMKQKPDAKPGTDI